MQSGGIAQMGRASERGKARERYYYVGFRVCLGHGEGWGSARCFFQSKKKWNTKFAVARRELQCANGGISVA